MPGPQRDAYRDRVVPLSTLGLALVLTVLISITLTLAVDRGVLGGAVGPRGPQGPPGPAADPTAAQVPTEPVFEALESDPERLAAIVEAQLDARDAEVGRKVSELKAELVTLCDTIAETAALQAEGIQCP
jgi:hypothetical protein